MAQITDDVHKLSGKPQCASGKKAVLFSVITCSIYMFYWIYKIGGELTEVRRNNGLVPDAVPNSTYKWIIIITTFLSTMVSALEVLGEMPESFYENINDPEAAMVFLITLCAAVLVAFVVQIVLSVILLWVVYNRSEASPKTRYVLMFLMRTHIFTLGFLQASLNDIADAQEDGIIPTKSV
jgi:hypothetical protein